MEKLIGWAHKLGGVESLWISKAGHTVLARLMKSQIWHQPTSSVRGSLSKGIMVPAHPDARHFSLSQYATDAFQAASPALKLRGSEFE